MLLDQFGIGSPFKQNCTKLGLGNFNMVLIWTRLGATVSYFDLSVESLPKLRQFLDEAVAIANQRAGRLGYPSI